jgi:hypothetical protein
VIYSLLADAVLVVHLLFVLFVILGGLLCLRRPRVAWAHIPAALWGASIELAGWVCPLTPLENHLRRLAGGEGYSVSFVEQYLLPVLYPARLTRGIQLLLGGLVLLVNAGIYAYVLRRSVTERARGA